MPLEKLGDQALLPVAKYIALRKLRGGEENFTEAEKALAKVWFAQFKQAAAAFLAEKARQGLKRGQ